MLDGTDTRMLRVVHNVSWRDNIPNKTLYGDLQPISNVIRKRNLKLTGHTFRAKSSPVHSLVTWDPQHGVSSVERSNATFVDTLLRDTGMENATQLEKLMENRAEWRHLTSRCCDNSKDNGVADMLDDRTFCLSSNMAAMPLSFWISRDWLQTKNREL